MKKSLQLLLASTMVVMLLFSGCGKQDTAGTDPADAGKKPETSTDATDKVRSAALGTFENGAYENTYVGIGCKLDENWKVATAEQLQKLPDAIEDILKDTEIGNVASGINQIVDVQGQNTKTAVSFNLLYTELTAPERLSSMMMSDDDIVETNLSNEALFTEAYTQMGLTVESLEKHTATYLGEERVGMLTTASANGQTLYMMQFFDYDLGGKYGVTTTFTGFSLESIQEAMDLFYKVG